MVGMFFAGRWVEMRNESESVRVRDALGLVECGRCRVGHVRSVSRRVRSGELHRVDPSIPSGLKSGLACCVMVLGVGFGERRLRLIP